MKTKDYKEISVLYQESIDRTSLLMKTFSLDEPISIFAMYVYLYRNGYLSYNHQFNYDLHLKDLPCLYGADVVEGKGVCRSIASNLSDIYKNLGYDSETFAVYTSSEACKKLEHLCPIGLQKDESTAKFVKVITTLLGKIHMPNHLILNVRDDKASYTLDPTNDGLLFPNGKNLLVPTNPGCKMILSLNSTRFQRFLGQLDGELNLRKLKDRLNMPSIDIEEYRHIYLETLKLCRDNPDVFEHFYLESKELYEEIHSLMKKQKGLMGRKLPAIPNVEKILKRK